MVLAELRLGGEDEPVLTERQSAVHLAGRRGERARGPVDVGQVVPLEHAGPVGQVVLGGGKVAGGEGARVESPAER